MVIINQLKTESKKKIINDDSNKKNNSFEWGLRPLIILSMLFGFHLNKSQVQTKINFVVKIFGVALLILNLAFNGTIFWHTFAKHVIIGKPVLNKIGKVSVAASTINSLIGVFIITFLPIGVHLFFVWSSLLTSRLTKLWETLIQIQEEMKVGRIFYKKCRRYCWVILGLLFLDGAAYFQQSLSSTYYTKQFVFPMEAAVTLGNVFHLIAILIQSLFFAFVAIAIQLFVTLTKRIETLTECNYAEPRFSKELEKWRRHHELVCSLVHHINTCFGTVLMITFISTFGGGAKYSTQMLNMERTRWTDYIFILGEMYHRFLLIIIISYHIKSMGSGLNYAMRSLMSSTSLNLQAQITVVQLQVASFDPSINSMDIIYPVDLTMIPAMLGILLTYCIILYQANVA